MKIFFRFIIILLSLLSGLNCLYSQWVQSSGPIGDDINCVAVNGNVLLTGTSGGVFRSSDKGATWLAVNTGASTIVANALSVSGLYLFAATDAGVFRSMDNGSNWTAVNSGLPNVQINSLTANETTLFAGTTNNGIYLSTNNGASWTPANAGLGYLNNSWIVSLAVLDSDVYAWQDSRLVGGDGVFRSTDNGANWVKTPLPYYGGVGTIARIDTILFAVVTSSINRSTDNGVSWMEVGAGVPNFSVRKLIVAGNTLFVGTFGGGVFQSTDYGTSWTAVNTGLTNYEINTLTIEGTYLYAGTNGDGMFCSTDNGAHWSPVNFGLSGISGKTVDVTVASGACIFAGTYQSGIYRSTDNGTNWLAVNAGLLNKIVYSFFVSDSTIFAGTAGGIFRTTNNGASWSQSSTGLTNQPVHSLVGSGTNLFAGTNAGVFHSTDNGYNWTAANVGLTDVQIIALAISGTNLYAGTPDRGIFLSTNNGLSWSEANAGLTIKGVYAFTMIGSTVYAATGSGVVRRGENDRQWLPADPLWNATGFALVSYDSILYTGGYGAARSIDRGITWKNIGVMDHFVIESLTGSGSYLFAGGGNGVWKLSIPDIIPIPSTPLMISPLNGQYEVPINPTFTWNETVGATSYQFQLSADSNFSSPMINKSGITSPMFDLIGLDRNRTYYWRINAANALGTSLWSPFRKFSTIVVIPVAPTLLSPNSQNPGYPTSLSLTWSLSPGAKTYHVQLSTDSNFTVLIIDNKEISLTSYAITGLANYTLYYWRVRAMGTVETSPWSTRGRFTTKLSDPIPIAPINGASGIALNTTLQWSTVKGRGWYSVQVSTDSNFTIKIVDEFFFQSESYPVTGLSNNKRYYWRVKVQTAFETDPWSATQTFTTVLTTPDKVVLLSPPQGSKMGTDSVHFVWKTSRESVDMYELELTGDSTIIHTSADTTLVLRIPAGLSEKTLSWKVRAKNSAGFGPFSEVLSFFRITTSASLIVSLPKDFVLDNNYPNPFNPSTTISFSLPSRLFVTMKIFDIMGREVATLVNEELPAGTYSRTWNAGTMPSGAYFYRLQAGEYSETKHFVHSK
jgi:hypothetical protein